MTLSKLTGEATCDGKPITKVAANLPKIKSKISKRGVIDHNKLHHGMLIHIVDKLYKYPQFIQSIHMTLFSEDFPIPAVGDDIINMEELWLKVKAVRQILVAWKLQFLCSRYKATHAGLLATL